MHPTLERLQSFFNGFDSRQRHSLNQLLKVDVVSVANGCANCSEPVSSSSADELLAKLYPGVPVADRARHGNVFMLELLKKDIDKISCEHGETYDLVKKLRAMHAIASAINRGDPVPTDEELGLVSSCFIATAACGTPIAPEVTCLRTFRENVLHRSAAGRAVIQVYEGASPCIAKLITASPTLRSLVRILLVKPAAALVKRYTAR